MLLLCGVIIGLLSEYLGKIEDAIDEAHQMEPVIIFYY